MWSRRHSGDDPRRAGEPRIEVVDEEGKRRIIYDSIFRGESEGAS